MQPESWLVLTSYKDTHRILLLNKKIMEKKLIKTELNHWKWFYPIGSFLVMLIIITGCKKDEEVDPIELPSVTTATISSITANFAISGGNVSDDGGGVVESRGVVWSTSENPTVDSNQGFTTNGDGTGSFTSEITGLTPGTTYYVRAYATNSAGTAYGNEVIFITEEGMAEVVTLGIIDISGTTATGGGNVIDDKGDQVTARGVVWSTSEQPSISDYEGYTVDGSGIGAFFSELTELTPLTEYFVRAYATNSAGTSYGTQVSFSTPEDFPTVTTNDITEILFTSAKGGGNVISDGGGNVAAYGIVWSTSEDPTVQFNEGITIDGEGTGEFSSALSGLQPNTTYYVRAYATNNSGTAYGDEISFTTEDFDNFIATDIDGNEYGVVLIGSQVWMTENLKTTKYNDGTAIDFPGDDNAAWEANTSGAYAWYNNDQDLGEAYGALYNWYAVETGKLCPSGWRVATNEDWLELFDFITEDPDYIGQILKSCRQVNSWHGGECDTDEHPRWNESSQPGNDDYGFGVLPAGFRADNGSYQWLGTYAHIWTSSERTETNADSKLFYYNRHSIWPRNSSKKIGMSVRCILDE